MKIYRSDRAMRGEEKASKHINVLSHYDDTTLLDKSNKLIQIIKIRGIDALTQDEKMLDAYKNRRNNLLKSFSSEFALYFWEVRRKSENVASGEFSNDFARNVNDKYKKLLSERDLYTNDLYLAVISKPSVGKLGLGLHFLKSLNHRINKVEKQIYLAKQRYALGCATQKIMSSLSDYHPSLLSVYEKNSVRLSEPLEFLSQIINFDKRTIPLIIEDAAQILPHYRLFFSKKSGTIEIRKPDNTKKFAAMLSIKAYQPFTYQGMLDEISSLPIEYTLSQSFLFYEKQIAKTRLRDQQKEMLQTKDESVSQTNQISDVFDDTASGEVGYGSHYFTIACYADTQDKLNQHVATLVAKFSEIDITCVREDVTCESAFWAQLPGNFGYICRPADISTKNFASFMSLHNQVIGKKSGNHWQDSVTVFETYSGSPYHFNFHYKDVGNFLVFGAMGSGKTVLTGFLILQSMKFRGKRVIFDKDRGLEIAVRAMNGVYETIRPGISTGFNPCQLSDTPENRKFLSTLLNRMLNEKSSEQDASIIETAIDGLYRLPKEERQFKHMASFFGARRPDSLRARFDQWHSDGAHAWLFDNAEDTLNLNPDVIGFDLGHILADKDCKTPALMYLTYCVEKAIENQRGILFIDEGWLALNDDYFREMIQNWARTPRKKNNIFGLATQVANDAANSIISNAIIESAFCKIFFPNPSADRKVYIDSFGLTEREYELIKTLPDDKHYFLLVHGRGIHKESVVLRANLTGMEDEIAIISAREETLRLLDILLVEASNDPQIWIPLFHERRKLGELYA